MKMRRLLVPLIASAALLSGAVATPAQASGGGDRSLAEVLTSDGDRFDHDWADYDILTEAVLAVLAEKPDSPVGLLADGDTRLTAFIPNDFSFRALTRDLTGRWYRSEERVFTELAAAVGIDNIEAVLLYHVIPGATIDARAAFRSDRAVLPTALEGSSVKVDVIFPPIVRLRDGDPNDRDPFLNPRALDINKGNKQIAHGIIFVLRPIDL